jgi:uncharacterized DUF497 family protein
MKRTLRETKEKTETPYKNTEQAWYEKEQGNPKEDVVVVDKFGNYQVVFKWTRKKSNENIFSTGTGKEGFSFYFARYIFTDSFLYENDALSNTDGATGVIGRINIKNREMLVINAVEEATDTIRIISAYYADDPKYELFVEKYRERAERGIPNKPKKEGPRKVYSIMAGRMPEAIKNRIERSLEKNSGVLREKFKTGAVPLSIGTPVKFIRFNKKWEGIVSDVKKIRDETIYIVENAVCEDGRRKKQDVYIYEISETF